MYPAPCTLVTFSARKTTQNITSAAFFTVPSTCTPAQQPMQRSAQAAPEHAQSQIAMRHAKDTAATHARVGLTGMTLACKSARASRLHAAAGVAPRRRAHSTEEHDTHNGSSKPRAPAP